MAKIYFRVRDKEKKVISGASLVMSCKLSSGKSWQSESQITNNSGVIWLEVDDKIFANINWSAISLEIQKNKQKLKSTFPKPKELSRDSYQIMVTVEEAEKRDATTKQTLIVLLLDKPGKPVSGADVALLSGGKAFGNVQTGAKGQASLTLTQADLKNINWEKFEVQVSLSEKPLKVLQLDRQEQKETGAMLVQITVAEVKGGGLIDKPRERTYEVSGQITSDDGRPKINLTVEAIDKGIGEEKPLGKTTTDKGGKYLITYTKADLLKPDKGSANLIVRVKENDKAKENLAASKMKENARPKEIVNLTVDRTQHRGQSLFDMIANSVAVLGLAGKYEKLSDDDTALIAKETEYNQETISQFIQSQILASDFKPQFNAEAMFGVIRAGLDANIGIFSSTRDSKLTDLLTQALEENWINDLQPKSLVDSVRSKRVAKLLESGEQWVATLKANGAKNTELNKLANAYLKSDLPLDQLVKQMQEDGELTAKASQSMLDGLELFRFAGDNEAFLQELMQKYKISKLVELARFTEKDWQEIADKYFEKMPDWVEGDSREEQVLFLAEKLQCMVEQAFPTAVFAERWKADKKMSNQPVQTYLAANTDFDFVKQSLEAFWNSGKAPNQNTQKQLLRCENLFHISPACNRFPPFKALWLEGFNSANDVLDKGRGGFVEVMKGHEISESVANEIFQLAQRMSSRDLLSTQIVPVAIPDTPDSSSNPVKVEPTIAALFGAQGGNGCEHCVSAFSPSAYLIDLLRFLQKARTPNVQKNGLELLFERRPDIANLEMDCPNSETPMPYIDLVNEILEHVVATSAIPFKLPDDWKIEDSHALQTEMSAEDLAAHPEHLNIVAYNRLRSITSPWVLPYNLWADEVRTYLTQIGVDRTTMMAVLRPDQDPFKVLEIPSERLGIGPTDAIVITQPANTGAKRALIWQSTSPAVQLKKLQLFLKRTDLSYEQASGIFATQFVNPQQKQILPIDLSDLDSAELVLTNADNNGLLDKFHRFTRLWQKTGWKTVELDTVLKNAAANQLNANGLIQVGIVAELHHQYKTPVEELAAWFGDLNTHGNKHVSALYQRNFLDGTVNGVVQDGALNLLEDVFALVNNSNNPELKVTTQPNSFDKWLAQKSGANDEWELHPDYAPIVLGGCKATTRDLVEMLNSESLATNNDKLALNLANLSQIYRTVSKSKALGISVEEFIKWQKVVPESSKAVPAPAETLVWLHNISKQITTGVAADNVVYGLLGETVEGLSLLQEGIDTLFESIHSELNKTATDFKVDALNAEDKLTLWLSIFPQYSETDVKNIIAIIEGDADPTSRYQPALNLLLSNDDRTRLFADKTITDKSERLELTAAGIPHNADLLNQTDALLRQDENIEDATIKEILGILTKDTLGSSSPVNQIPGYGRLFEILTYLGNFELNNLTVDERLKLFNSTLFDYWLRRPVVVQQLAETTGVSEKHIELLSATVTVNQLPLIQRLFKLQEDGASGTADLSNAIQQLNRQAALVTAAELGAEEVQFLLQHAGALGIIDFRNLAGNNFLNWHKTVTLHELNGYVSGETDIYDYLQTVIDEGAQDVVRGQLAQLFGVTLRDLTLLTGAQALNFAKTEDFLGILKLERLFKACNYLKQMGVDAGQVLKLAEPILNTEHANIAKAAVRSHYDETNWREVSQKLRKDIRERQRDALLAFVCTRGGLDLSHEAAYAYYLIDVDMGSCYQTSRTKQAIASVQQFVQRTLLGLEYDGLPAQGKPLFFLKEDAPEWKWRKNYRVWEANVKVFVYPENWLEPELRDNKTPFFKDLEQELMQGDLTTDLAETAVTNYLQKLHEVGNLEMMNLFYHHRDKLLYVVARTRNVPHQYYLRTLKNNELWSPWQKIDTEIEGEHVIPVVYNNRLYIFWPTFTEELDEEKLEDHPINDEIAILNQQLQDLGDEHTNGSILGNLYELRDIYIPLQNDTYVGVAYRQMVTALNATIAEKEKEKKELEVRSSEKNREYEQIKKRLTYFNIELNWITQLPGGWSGKQLSKGMLTGPKGVLQDQYRFTVEIKPHTGLTIKIYTGVITSWGLVVGGKSRQLDTLCGFFRMQDCNGDMVAYSINGSVGNTWRVFKSSALINTQHLIICSTNMSTEQRIPLGIAETGEDLLVDTPYTSFMGVTACQENSNNKYFFLADKKRTFFVAKTEENLQSSANGSGASTNSMVSGIEKSTDIEHIDALINRRGNVALTKNVSNPQNKILNGEQNTKALTLTQEVAVTQASTAAASTADVVTSSGAKYKFDEHYHAFTCAFLRQINRFGLKGLYDPDIVEHPGMDTLNLFRQLTLPHGLNPANNFNLLYHPNRNVVEGKPRELIDFSYGSSYGQYNWEVFFHTPMLIAVRLMQNLKFEEAQKWFHYIFDPTERDGVGLQKYWKIKPFFKAQILGLADDDLDEQLDWVDDNEAMSLEAMIEEWETNPFQPHTIARFRIVAYMRMTVMKYLDNLIAWGDSLFKRDTMESINEATQLYVLAATILGERPLIIDEPERKEMIYTVREFLEGREVQVSSSGSKPAQSSDGLKGEGALGILGVLDQFCQPFNDRLLDYWDTVADRLFKIRHCLNIDGVYRQLPLYQPPIDPALLVKAAASGVDISAALSDLAAPRPNYRFTYMMQKASELVSQTQSLGASLLSALEKKDGEEIARIRSENEVTLLKANIEIRKLAIKEAKESLESIESGKEILEAKRDFFQNRKRINEFEAGAEIARATAFLIDTGIIPSTAVAGVLNLIPSFRTGAAGMGPLLDTEIISGDTLSKAQKASIAIMQFLSEAARYSSAVMERMGERKRRDEEWDFTVEEAKLEIKQAEKQIAAAEIRLAMAENELANHEKQIEHAEEANAFIKNKFTNKELYSWMVSQISTLYFQMYQLAYDIAKQAEKCYQHELGIPNTNFIQFGYWDSLKKGLLAGERLQLDLKRLETSYLEKNNRELELSKTVSLALLNPEALLRLRETGECFISLPEVLFDMDYPGHYFRRIKSVSLTLPAITGPYTSVSCTLTLLSDKYRKEAKTGDSEDSFEWNVGKIQSIATSSGQSDSGLFQLDFRDERYLPFERAGAISNWKLNLPKPDLAQFDYSTISDVLIQVNYTARDGGQAYREQVETNLIASLNSVISENSGLPHLLSLKNHFPDAWAKMANADKTQPFLFEFSIGIEHLPYFVQRRTNTISQVKLIAIAKDGAVLNINGASVSLTTFEGATNPFQPDPQIGSPVVVFTGQIQTGEHELEFPSVLLENMNNIKDIMVISMLNIGN